MGQWVSDNHTAVDAYGGSALPFASGSIAVANGVAKKITFPYVTRWIQVFNNDSGGNDGLRVGFTANGVNSLGTPPEHNYFVVPAGSSSARLEVKCTAIFLAGDGGDVSACSVIAGYTAIPKDNYPLLSGSNSFEGVG